MVHTATSEGFPAIAASAALQSALAGLDVSLDEELERYSTWRARGRMATESVYRPPTRTAPRAEPTIDLPLRLGNLTPAPVLPEEPTEPLVAPVASATVPAAPEPDEEIESAPPPEEHPLAGLWTPAGIASFGLLAAASFTLGWFLLDPAGLGRFLQPSAPPPNEGSLPQSLSEPADATVAVPVREPLPTGFVPLPGLGDRPGQSQAAFTSPPATAPTVSVARTAAPSATPALRELDLPPVPANAPPVEPARRIFGAAPVFPQAPDPEPVVARPRPVPEPEPVVIAPPRPRRLASPPAALPARPPVIQAVPPAAPLNPVPAAATALPPAPQWAPPVGLAVTPAPAPPPPANPVRYAEPIAPAPAATTYTIVAPPSFANQARQMDQDAFVRPQDGQVQLGAYRDPMAAQQRIAELRSQGIPAELR